MVVKAWTDGKGTFGIRVGPVNRDQWFDRSWREIEVELDGRFHTFRIRESFWRKCPEFRDSGTTAIRDWLRRHKTLKWEFRQPPTMELQPVVGRRFRLLSD